MWLHPQWKVTELLSLWFNIDAISFYLRHLDFASGHHRKGNCGYVKADCSWTVIVSGYGCVKWLDLLFCYCRFLAIAGQCCQVAAMDWQTKKLMCEINVMETIQDVKYELHNHLISKLLLLLFLIRVCVFSGSFSIVYKWVICLLFSKISLCLSICWTLSHHIPCWEFVSKKSPCPSVSVMLTGGCIRRRGSPLLSVNGRISTTTRALNCTASRRLTAF